LRVTSYNILADHLLEHTTPKDSLNKNEEFLSWDHRKSRIITELTTLNSDVICCQEFVKDEKFIEEMGKYGYNVAFKPRTGGNHSEGCAIFWKYDK
jgi:mRNA deadenylase 3'-5' endonuclease subunit Ccr4